MGISKHLNLENFFLFLFLVLFPFGQIIRIGVIQPVDVVAGIGAIVAIFKKYQKPAFFKYFENFLLAAGFSWLVYVFIFNQVEVFYGLLYFVRLTAYFYFLIYVWNYVAKNGAKRKILLDSLLAVSVVSAIFGWIQYFAFPNIKPFTVWGWDDHLYRLVGTFLDPTFLGIIIVFGLVLSIYKLVNGKKWQDILITVFLLISLAFTYSRASYLAFLGGVLALGFYQKSVKQIIYLVLGLAVIIAILPTSGNAILRITREFSAIARIENYSETLQIFKSSPLAGVGYDNLCLARAKSSGIFDTSSHACSGSDSSLLFVLATTGLAGFIIFINLIYKVWEKVPGGGSGAVLNSSFFVLLIHSFFSNSMFYPWVMGWMIILLATSLGREV